jgi:hypothetical protein
MYKKRILHCAAKGKQNSVVNTEWLIRLFYVDVWQNNNNLYSWTIKEWGGGGQNHC